MVAIDASALLQRGRLGGLVPALLPEFGQIFDRRVVVLFVFGQTKAGWIYVRLFRFCFRAANGSLWLITRAKGNELIGAGKTFKVDPFLAADFLLTGLYGKVHVTAFGRRVGITASF